jgi:DNA-binding IscR family transcriptional regulator
MSRTATASRLDGKPISSHFSLNQQCSSSDNCHLIAYRLADADLQEANMLQRQTIQDAMAQFQAEQNNQVNIPGANTAVYVRACEIEGVHPEASNQTNAWL